ACPLPPFLRFCRRGVQLFHVSQFFGFHMCNSLELHQYQAVLPAQHSFFSPIAAVLIFMKVPS
ncbi:MAG TPA: hypothetical protein H9745_01245, partial [Candidatus Agathobaculum stercoravium]|nr:hypothetical protein [Candidatus Agathobaculum stercoravium]